VTLPFSAVFYNYPSTSSGGAKIEDGPSPYVGQIDLENGLPNPEEEQRLKRKLQSRYQELRGTLDEGTSPFDNPAEASDGEGTFKTTKSKRSSRLPKAPPGGGYRIPEKGQLQIIIKNQNKTAVKLFLVPYDLAGMEPGTKTFIRQRSYSTGPIIEAEVPASKDSGRPTLRYLIHLHICCPSKGRYYLYKSIRVVFANRVPDGKEQLRNEVTFPDPRFTPYKPIRVMHPPMGSMGGGGGSSNNNNNNNNMVSPSEAALAAESAIRRRSTGFSFSHHHPHYNFVPHPQPMMPETPPPLTTTVMTASATSMQGVEMTGPSTNSITPIQSIETYDKLSKGDAGYGGAAGAFNFHHHHHHNNNNSSTTNGSGTQNTASSSPAAAEGLLSKRLRSLGVQQQQQHERRYQHPSTDLV
jgi:hypothetical protein